MSLIKKELTEKSGFTMEFSISKDALEKAKNDAYKKQVKSIKIPGFRPGKAPRSIIEKLYGKDVFFEDAVNACIPEAFEAAAKEAELTIVGTPSFSLVSEDGDIVLKAVGFVKPEVTIENYKGIEAKKKVSRVTANLIDAELEKVRERNARTVEITDRAALLNDTVNIDFEGFVDGVAFDGGKAQGHSLKLGSKSFIPGFEDQIVGKSVGEEFDVNVTFPKDYAEASLAKKPAVFKVKLNSISFDELPVLDDEFAKDVSEFDTLDEYKNDIKAKLKKRNEETAQNEFENAVVESLIEKLVAEIPEPMFEAETENFVRDYDNQLRSNGLDLNTYFKYTGITLESLRKEMRPRAEKQLKLRLALEKIAELEALTVADEQIEQEYTKLAEAYNIPLDNVKGMIAAEDIKFDLLLNKALDLVKESAVVVK